MSGLRLFIAVLLPWLTGTMVVRGLWDLARRRLGAGVGAAPGLSWAVALGYGYMLGIFATSLTLRLWSAVGLTFNFMGLCLVLAAYGALAWALIGPKSDLGLRMSRPSHPWARAAFWALLGWLAVRYAGFFLEIIWRPLFAWDAWWLHAPRARVWFDLGHMVPMVSDAQWWASPNFIGYAFVPDRLGSIPLIQTWMALAWGSWDDSMINLPWLGCAVALGLACFGQARAAGYGPAAAMVMVYLLLSLPFLGVHVALPGYMDLWLGATYGMAAMAFFLWVRSRDPGQLLLFGVAVTACVLSKAPGIFWALSFVPAFVVARWDRKGLVPVLAGMAFLLMGRLLLPGDLQIELPGVGRLLLDFRVDNLGLSVHEESLPQTVGAAILRQLLLFGNWHLFGYAMLALAVAAPGLIWIRRVSAESLLVLQAFLFIGFIFFFTGRAVWAVDNTLFNRVLLHAVPMLMFYLFWIAKQLNWEGYLAWGRPLRARSPDSGPAAGELTTHGSH